MENRFYTSGETSTEYLSLYLDPAVTSEVQAHSIDLSSFKLESLEKSQFALLKKGDRLWVNLPDGNFCDFPFYLKNIRNLLNGFTATRKPKISTEPFQALIKTAQNIEKRIFSNVSLNPGENVKDLWDEIIKKTNAISNESHSLRGLVEKILEVPFLQNFETSLIFLHLKGQTKAELLGVMWRNEKIQSFIVVKDFNTFFNSVKKSKIKSFTTDSFPKLNLPFNGSFLAKEVISKKYSLVAMVSRHDFLSFNKEEVELYETCIDLLQPHFERLVDQEFSDKRISELRICLKDFPLPLRIKDTASGASFLNDLYQNELQDKDIFFNKKVQGPFNLDLYDSDELRHYAFDLFHFQRISLLGELLNTLRHELSNPLFGLKLGSQIFSSLEVSSDNKDIIKEIEKNVDRCQIIIENFSNLYQVQNETKPVSIHKILEEAVVLSKSEGRELHKIINFEEGTKETLINVPLIFVVQIIFNLIVNAAQAMKNITTRKELNIQVSKSSTQIFIDLYDNGPGIPEDKQSQLFKPFFTTKSQGTGLGLVLSRNLALKMGGNLEFIAEKGEKGAHFKLTLPLT